MPALLSTRNLSNTNVSMEKLIENKDEPSASLTKHNKQQSNNRQDLPIVEKINSAHAVILDIPKEVIKQSRILTNPSRDIRENTNPSSPSSLAQADQQTINCLKSDWLEEAEKVIASRYGLTGDGADLSIVLDNNPEPYLASTNFELGPDGKANNESLHIVVQTALPATLPDGGEVPYYDDRVITHEMVHAIMGRTMNVQALPTWFDEGTAEFIHGADERIGMDLSRHGSGIAGATSIQNALGNGTDDAWRSDSLHYSAATMAVRYLHKQIQATGHRGGIKDLLTDLKDNPTENFDQALSHVTNYPNMQAFINDYVKGGNGAKFIHNLDNSGEFVNAQNGGDTGGIGGEGADNGPVQTSKTVIPDINNPTDTPLEHFHVIWPILDSSSSQSMQLSTNQNKQLHYKAPRSDSKVIGTYVDITK